MNRTLSIPVRITVGILAVIGLVGVLPVSLAEITLGSACPSFGPIPACHLVSIAYTTILVTVLHRSLWKPHLFLYAWVPIFLLALAGSGFELAGHGTCPKTSGGIPKCFFSLGLAVFLIFPVIPNLIASKKSRYS